jgi:hypothetical protein
MKILRALAEGSTVTKLTALHQRIGNVADVVMHLRRLGWDIQTAHRRDLNGEDYCKYVLAERQRPAALEFVGSKR